MEVIKTGIDGVLIIEPKVFGDKRGYFFESFSQREFNEKVAPILGHTVNFVQDNESMSSYGVMRGLHFQRPPFTQSKLVRCVKGTVLDVAVDIRKGSPTYGKHVSCLLCGSDMVNDDVKKKLSLTSSLSCDEIAEAIHRQFFIPKGFAHGFVVLSKTALFQYKCDEFYHSEAEGAIMWNDPDLAIEWPVKAQDIKLSEKDKHHPFLKDFESPFLFNPSTI